MALIAGFRLVWQLANPAANPIQMRARTRAHPAAVAVRNLLAAAYLEQRLGSQGRVVAGVVGLLGYRFSETLWDLYGLASYDRTLRHAGALESYVNELLQRGPDAIPLCFDAKAYQPPRPCQHAERVIAAQPEFRANYAAAAEFGRREVPSAYHVIFERTTRETMLAGSPSNPRAG